MKITKLAVAVVSIDGVEGRLVTAEGFLPGNAELDGTDLVALTQALEEGQSLGKKSAPADTTSRRRGRTEEPAPTGEAEAPAETSRRRSRGAATAEPTQTQDAPTEGRRRRSAAPAETSDAEPATTGTGEGRRRRRVEEPAAEAPTEGRRRRAEAPAAEEPKTPSDSDLVKAATAANEALHKAIGSEGAEKIADLIFEYDNAAGKECVKVHEIKPEDRDDFLKRLKALVADNS